MAPTACLISVDGQGHTLCCEDTGPPVNANDTYTTLIVVHGTAFHGQIFRRLLPLAPKHQLRLVIVNRRDYPGSSPYTEEDLTKNRTDYPDTHAEFARARAAEFAEFIRNFVGKANVPKTSSDRKSGGVVLLSWSAGNAYTLPLLSYMDFIPESTRKFIEPYLRSHIVFDAPRFILGVPPISPGIDFLSDESLTQEERCRHFNELVGAYYTHRSFTSRNIADLQIIPAGDARTSTTESMTSEELRETTCYEAVLRSENGVQTASPEIYVERLRRALFDDELAKYLPMCNVDVVWCENSTWESVDVMWGFLAAREKADKDGIVGRPLRIIKMAGANHFPHWDEPEKTMEFFAKVVTSSQMP